MPRPFHIDQFEKLSGLDLEFYVAEAAEHAKLPEDFLDYVRERSGEFDSHHLQMALFLLVRIGTAGAYREVSKYMNHPDLGVRILAKNAIASLPSIDEFIADKIISALQGDREWHEIAEIREALKRPSNEEAAKKAKEYFRQEKEKLGDL